MWEEDGIESNLRIAFGNAWSWSAILRDCVGSSLQSGDVGETLATLVAVLQSAAEIYGVSFKPLI
jgi:hypothetical protein